MKLGQTVATVLKIDLSSAVSFAQPPRKAKEGVNSEKSHARTHAHPRHETVYRSKIWMQDIVFTYMAMTVMTMILNSSPRQWIN